MNNVPPYLQSYPCLPTGSRVICDPPVMDTDEDYLILVTDGNIEIIYDLLEQDEYIMGGSQFDESKFSSWKNKDGINILLTHDKDYFDKFSKATSLAKALNLKEKSDRITLFEAVVSDSWPGEKKEYRYKRDWYGKSMGSMSLHYNTINPLSIGTTSPNLSVWQVGWGETSQQEPEQESEF